MDGIEGVKVGAVWVGRGAVWSRLERLAKMFLTGIGFGSRIGEV